MLNDDALFSPTVCFFCGEPITVLEGHSSESICTHHIDWNEDNNEPTNVAFSHRGCHTAYHLSFVGIRGHNYDHGKGDICQKCGKVHIDGFRGKKHTDETKKKMSRKLRGIAPWNKGLKGYKKTDPRIIKISVALRGRETSVGRCTHGEEKSS
jgi:hypothetical protein